LLIGTLLSVTARAINKRMRKAAGFDD